jgi:ribosomal protein S18 acetylase RimI-like enzyme
MKRDEIAFRNATPDDIHAIVELWNESALYHAAHEPRYQFALDVTEPTENYYLKHINSESSIVAVAQSVDSIIGFVCVLVQERPPVFIPRKFGFVDGIFVSPDVRRKGVGTRLWQIAIDWLQQKGVSKINLTVATRNPHAVEFWRKMGFSDLAIRMELTQE